MRIALFARPASTPMAMSTGLGMLPPLAQADPLETAMPF